LRVFVNRYRLLRRIGLLLVSAAALPVHAQESRLDTASAAICRHTPIGSGVVQAVTDGRSFVLADGREIRLAGIEVPAPRARDPAAPPAYDGRLAKSALAALVEGTEIILNAADAGPDRYGRVVADVIAARDGRPRSVVEALLAGGHGWVSPHVDPACAADLFTSERAARQAKLGLWSDPYYEIRSADHPVDILAGRGRFTLVEGKVISVREAGGTIYVNFGRRWTEDFTATVPKRDERAFVGAGLEPKKLQGRRIRVRGWIEDHGAPSIELTHPEQIEIVEDD
jgi:endonuclease YncB( thermonuclease family)